MTLGNDIISPRIAHKIEDLIRNFQEIIKLRMDIEEFNRDLMMM